MCTEFDKNKKKKEEEKKLQAKRYLEKIRSSKKLN